MIKNRHIVALATLIAASAVAGPADKAPVIENPTCAVPFTGEVSLGYETNYIFRGVNLGEDAPWASAGLNFPINDKVSVDVGTWYLNSTNNPKDFDELDTYAFLNFPLLGLDASLGGTWDYFPEQNDNTGELSLGLSKDLKIFELGGFAAYDLGDIGGWYFETRALRTIALTNCLDLNLGAGLSFTEDYSFRTPYLGADGWESRLRSCRPRLAYDGHRHLKHLRGRKLRARRSRWHPRGRYAPRRSEHLDRILIRHFIATD